MSPHEATWFPETSELASAVSAARDGPVKARYIFETFAQLLERWSEKSVRAVLRTQLEEAMASKASTPLVLMEYNLGMGLDHHAVFVAVGQDRGIVVVASTVFPPDSAYSAKSTKELGHECRSKAVLARVIASVETQGLGHVIRGVQDGKFAFLTVWGQGRRRTYCGYGLVASQGSALYRLSLALEMMARTVKKTSVR
jgi:hypothetical protein